MLMKNTSRKEGSLAYQSYPGRANFSYNPLTGNLANDLHEKQNVSAATPGHPPRRVTFFSIKQLWLAQTGKFGIDKAIRACASTVVSSWLGRDGSSFFSYRHSLNSTQLEG